jgi:legumain
VFHYDDIADNSRNPFKDNVINKPDGPNNYVDVPKDYTGDDCTAKNLLAVLQGQDMGGKKTLKSTKDDHVFIYFTDHGGPGLIAMPVHGYLYAKDLIPALENMHAKGMYKELVFYLEACESGSMFNNLLKEDINIYATTAANPRQSSYAWYYDSSRRTYLGDEYSVRWMEDSDAHPDLKETLGEQFDYLKTAVTKSQPQEYGDLKMRPEAIHLYQSEGNPAVATPLHKRLDTIKSVHDLEAVSSRDVELALLLRDAMESNELSAQQAVDAEVSARAAADKLHQDIVAMTKPAHVEMDAMMVNDYEHINFKCYVPMLESFEARCGRMTDYSLKYAYTFVNLCNHGVAPSTVEAIARQVC